MQQKKGIYRQRHPEQTACHKIFQNHYKSFRDSYEERYEWRYGYFRPLIDEELEKYLRCGILTQIGHLREIRFCQDQVQRVRKRDAFAVLVQEPDMCKLFNQADV